MRLANFIEYLRHRLKTVVVVCWVVLALLVVLDAIPAIVDKQENAHTAAEHLPAFWSLFGFLGCVAIIIGSKWFGHAGIMQPEDYYEQPESNEPKH